ncbi:MAG: NAD(P)H-binding protein, partial [Anaerolineae bacterium]|nr:NAD(P)H-binding protein [Anaerolineae bacterium]
MILVTGGQGMLGKVLVAQLAGQPVRITSRSASGANAVKSDFATGEGILEAVEGIDVIIHAASSVTHTREVDVEGTRRLLAASPHIRHFIYMSIVGVDRHPLPYYKLKYETEQVIMQSSVPWTIVRATQFHPFIALILSKMLSLPIGILPASWQTQPIAVEDVAAFLAELASDNPAYRVLD